jgi:hypothetical protein
MVQVVAKWCGGCEQSLPVSDFGKNRRAPDGLNWRCLQCARAQSRRYIHSDRGQQTRRIYADRTRQVQAAAKRRRRAAYAVRNPEKVKARELAGNAVRRGYMSPPKPDRNWHNQWEFHHPDHSRPYYGVWVTTMDHSAIERGIMECPPCVDYSAHVRQRLLEDWGLT